MLIAIEGVDGAGKRTLAEGLRKAFEAAGQSVATLAFRVTGAPVPPTSRPRRCTASTATWRCRCTRWRCSSRWTGPGAWGTFKALRRDHHVVIMDRFVASNAAYTAARLHQDADGPAVAWVHTLEYGRLKLPAPDRQVLLAVSAELAAERARSRAESDPGRARDSYERDDGLQQRTGAVYAQLAAAGWGGAWRVVDADVDPARLAADLAAG
uniref:Thymidylate kinase n=1 Tax=Mycobacterium paratuberculosis TaxID=1770 RepID=Q93CB9_MYCPC|nr:thimidylate kinase [Mycobacterium avium subsp. paratuberculosis]